MRYIIYKESKMKKIYRNLFKIKNIGIVVLVTLITLRLFFPVLILRAKYIDKAYVQGKEILYFNNNFNDNSLGSDEYLIKHYKVDTKRTYMQAFALLLILVCFIYLSKNKLKQGDKE